MSQTPPSSTQRTLALFRAGCQSTWARGQWPVGPLVIHGSLTALLCGLVRDTLPGYGYSLLALALSAATLALPLLGELGWLLRADSSAEWIEAQPVRRSELRLARILLVMTLLAALSSASLLPASVLAPDGFGAGARLVLIAAGLAQAVVVAAVLLGLQAAVGERAESLLVGLQTLLVAFVIAGLVVVPRFVPLAREWTGFEALSPLARATPPAWFAALCAGASAQPMWPAAAALAAALLVLFFAPLPPAPRARRTGTWMSFLLAPARAFVARVWLRARERASFDLVYDALPLEREFVLRSYPMLGIPMAFLAAGANESAGPMREALMSLLLFTPPIYLPVLLAHVPASASHEARWILDTAPTARPDIDEGALKAIAVRFLLPLYVLLFALAWAQIDFFFALRLSLPAVLFGWIVLRQVYPQFTRNPPLSVSAQEIEMPMDWTGPFMAVALGLTLTSIAAWAWITTWWACTLACVGLIVVARLLARRASLFEDMR